jgi:hypothetical protein
VSNSACRTGLSSRGSVHVCGDNVGESVMSRR